METTYEDFEPLCKWRREQKSDTLEVHLPGFKRQQLRVQLSSSGIITITGERQLDEAKAIKSRFRKEFPVSKDCQPNQIQAKFSNGVLSLVMLKQESSISGAGGNVTSGKFLSSIMNMNKRVALEIIIAICLVLAVRAYVKKCCQCSHLGN
ncbi:inactive protein RESTRICTED TEV MOVEMENT 2-like [Herrania umbratica]|uniref:Inactive protein RESTRICTED TEV MOVEMENT 2-like n=1 Tax=Herrania umbratica TaxID=108875 RepID=A0A6J1A8Q8_9ROSI|nr:inactive protein RESTRICTED TEV MOVEMENT 2-like [Herrania umbratica]